MPPLNETSRQSLVAARAQELFDRQWHDNAKRTDRMFAVLMILQWLGAIVASLVLSPRTWNGSQSQVHPHVWLSVFFGGALAILPVCLAWKLPGRTVTRHVIALAQIMFSSLLIHVTGGRIETHFHVFGSLAFLAFYRDWRVLIPATLGVAIDHFVRGTFWPQTVFGISSPDPWRWIEHAAWVVFEDVFLIISCCYGVREMWFGATRTAELESINRDMEQQQAELAAAYRTRQEQDRELRAAKELAEDANRAKSAFLANMSHEIRTPLTAILGFTDILLSDDEGSPWERRDHLQTIGHSGRHLLTLIDDVLDLSKIESDRIEVEQVCCSPHEIIAATTSTLRVRAAERGLTLEYFWKTEAPQTICSDPARLRQILMNLIGNAIKFTEVGSVQVSARLQRGESPRLVIDVIDTGIGIESERCQSIFDPFVQADSSITRRFGGTGLGLAISRRLAKLLGGDLEFESVAGRGSTFTVTIPTGPLDGVPMIQRFTSDLAAVSRPTVRTPRAAPRVLAGCRILLVEDGAMNRKLISLMLERAGAEVHCAENGRAGVETASSESFDLLLMDMQMPIMDGYQAASELRRLRYTVPIIALTAHAMADDGQKCREAGCSGYLTKPIDPQRLIATIEGVLAARLPRNGYVDIAEQDPSPLTSTLPADDPELAGLVDGFVIELQEKLVSLRAAWEQSDGVLVSEIAHGIKGTAGTFGFDAFTEAAGELEESAALGCSDATDRQIARIESLFRRIPAAARR